jgi:hypothetical protein
MVLTRQDAGAGLHDQKERQMTKLLTAAALACALTVLFAPAATGNPPTLVEQVEVNRDVVIAASPETCDFPIVAHIEGTRVVKDFTDQDGNLVRRVIHLRSFTITYTNPLSGKSLRTPLGGPAIGEPQTDGSWLVTVPGNDGRFVAPGEGLIFATVGLRIGLHVGTFPPATIDEIIKSVGQQDASEFPAVCGPLS